MSSFPALAELLAEPKLAALILDPAPSLVFDSKGTLRFANRAAVAAYGAATLAELIEKSASLFGEMPDTAREFSETLPLNGPYRREAIALARDTETFRCERISLASGLQIVLFTGLARERFDGDLGRAFGALFDGERAPFALFDHDGKPLHANRMASAIMGPAGTLAHLHASAAAALSDAKLKGFAEIPFGVLKIFLKKLSLGTHSLLLATFTQPERPAPPQPESQPQPEQAEAKPEPVQTSDLPRAEPEKSVLPAVIHLGPPAEQSFGWEVPALQQAPDNVEQRIADNADLETTETVNETSFEEIGPESAVEESAVTAQVDEHAIEESALEEGVAAEEFVAAQPPVEDPVVAELATDESAAETPAHEPAAENNEDQPVAEEQPVPAAVPAPEAETPKPVAPKSAPSRFVWQVDAEGRFTNMSADLADAVGATQSGRIGEDWPSLAARAGIANTDVLFASVKRRDTWSGVSVLWPVEGTDTARPVDLAALPVFDRDRNFLGYRGFGVFREAIPFIAKARPANPEPETVAETPEPTEETAANDEFPLSHEPAETAEAVRDEDPMTSYLSRIAGEQSNQEQSAGEERPFAADPAGETPLVAEMREDAIEVSAAEPAQSQPEALAAAAEENEVVPSEPPQPENRKALTPKEQIAFREIGRVLLKDTLGNERAGVLRDLDKAMGLQTETPDAEPSPAPEPEIAEVPPPPAEPAPVLAASADLTGASERALMDRIPLGIAVHRDEKLLYANRALLDWVGAETLEALEKSGGLSRIFSGAAMPAGEADPTIARTLAVQGPAGEPIPVETRLFSTPWYGKAALVYVLRRANAGFDERRETMERSLRAAEAATREQQAILDTATDGVLIIDRDGKILGMNKSAEALFSFDFAEVQNSSFTMLFAPESHRAAVDYLDKLATNGVASILNDGREVVGRERNGGLIPLFMNLGKVGEDGQKFCAVLRDITQWKRAEEELTGARRQAEIASSHKSDFLAKISHEMRTPLNAIIGFAEVMIEERFGPVGSERYRDYLKDIHQSGAHLISLINDLLDLSKIEAGKLELDFTSVDLNDVAKQCISIMQPQANRERIIIRTALAEQLPPVVADLRSIRQIALNLLSNSVKFTKPGGQVILSTSTTDRGEVVLRVRDTGVGMTEEEVSAALEPFRQLATSGRDTREGTGLGLPLTKALVEANRASFTIKSAVNSGTLIEIAFPSTRVLAG
jgi:PAS domain S-box-containing protein